MNIVKVIALLCVISLINVSTAKAVQYDSMPSVTSIVTDLDNSNSTDLDDSILNELLPSDATGEVCEFTYSLFLSTQSNHHLSIRAPPYLN
ncbi:hypothetical protein [Pseudoalteromonas phenolica]|uniref:hypothetical protein n=1 Tax=Pseudoalteromonas phenolica TaxID=161398 RepID=UPI00110BE0D3|nr:hypothetical protein [Pseudoalteromonas phenolica]